MWLQKTVRWRGLPLGHLQLLLRTFLLKHLRLPIPLPADQTLWFKVVPTSCLLLEGFEHTYLLICTQATWFGRTYKNTGCSGLLRMNTWGQGKERMEQNLRTLPPLWYIYHSWTRQVLQYLCKYRTPMAFFASKKMWFSSFSRQTVWLDMRPEFPLEKWLLAFWPNKNVKGYLTWYKRSIHHP